MSKSAKPRYQNPHKSLQGVGQRDLKINRLAPLLLFGPRPFCNSLSGGQHPGGITVSIKGLVSPSPGVAWPALTLNL